MRAADVVDLVDHRVAVFEDAVEELHLVHHTERTALLRRAVVGQHDEDGVVELAHAAQPVDQPADLVVGVIEERGERLLESGGDLLLVLGQVVPGVDARVAGRELGALGDHAEFELALVPTLADDVPALVVAPRYLSRYACGAWCGAWVAPNGHVREERAIGPHTLAVADHLHQLVDHVLADVIPVFGTARRFDRMVVAHQLRVELVGLTFEEPVEAVEAAGERPLVERTCRRALLHRREVPLADAERGVPLAPQHLGDGGRVVADVTELVREPGAEVRHRTHPDRVLRAPGEQRGPSRRAQRRHVEVGELQPSGSERVDVRRVDVGAVATELREAGVVEQDHHHVGSVAAGMRRVVEPRLRVGDRATDRALES